MIDFLLPGSTAYLVIKGLHIAAVVFWMAGMLYLPRLFVYHMAATPGGELEAALLKQERNLLKIIVNPAMIAVWVLAILMIVANESLWTSGWFHVKLVLVLALSGLHGVYAGAQRKFAAGERPRSERFWRIANEIPAIGVIVIALLAIVKPF